MTKHSGNSAPTLQVLREMFAGDERMQVTQDPDGTIRMRDSDVPRDLLNVKIAHLSFDDEQKKGNLAMIFPSSVLSFITAAPEVQAFMKSHGVVKRGGMLEESVGGGGPSATGELNNITLSESLDYMLKTFQGLWVYENCPDNAESSRRVLFLFYATGQRAPEDTKQR
jgi:hypothetical protein